MQHHSLRIKNKTTRRRRLKVKVVKKTLHHNHKSRHSRHGKDKCVTTFGTIIGQLQEVPAYSNCNNSFESHFDNVIRYKNKYVFSGMQWQCVEYVRRYLINKLGVTFESVDGAEDVFALKTVKSVETGKKYKFKTFKNNKNSNCRVKNNMPQVNDVIIWARNNTDTPYGHIAVILKVKGNQIFIGEQNWSNDTWASPHSHSRILTFIKYNDNNNGCLIIDDNYKILGWKRAMVDVEKVGDMDMPISLNRNP
jgi:glutathionylspermidine amidase/synthetase